MYTRVNDGSSSFWLDISSVPNSFSNLVATQANVATLNVTGNLNFTNVAAYVTVAGNITAGNIVSSTGGLYALNYYYPNGVPFTGGASSIPGGSVGMLQFGDTGFTFSGATYLKYDKTNGNLVSNSTTKSTSITTGAVVIGNGLAVGGNVFAGAIYSDNHFFANGTTITTPAGGSNTYVQFNDGGSFSGTSGLTFNKGTNAVTGTGAFVANSFTTTYAGQHIGYHTGAIGANVANTGVFTTLTATSGYQGAVNGPFNGTVGASTANTGAFTTITASSTAAITGNVTIGGSSGGVGALNINGTGPSPIGNRILFGTDGTGWQLRFGKNQAGAITDYIALNDSGTLFPLANNTYSLGSATANWSTVYAVTFSGTATTARYADLAENYLSDEPLDPGDVVIFGGRKEIKSSYRYADTRLAGVISTNPAYLMNSDLEDSYPVALAGRVPCKVLGPVSKGDVLTSSNIVGVAMVLDKADFEPGCVLGKSLEDHPYNTIKTIEIVAGRL